MQDSYIYGETDQAQDKICQKLFCQRMQGSDQGVIFIVTQAD